MRERSIARVLGVLLAVASLAFVMPTWANHTQTDTGKSIVFDEKPGNQWWVEVDVTGASAGQVTKVQAGLSAPNSSGGWVSLTKQNWGSYAASFSAPDGYVRFRATFADGSQAVSCWFKHPAGTEACSFPAPPGTWSAMDAGNAGTGYGAEAQVADIDYDGVGELVVAADEGVYTFDRTHTGWQRGTVITEEPFNYNMDVQDFDHIAIGSTDRDDIPEVYTSGRYYNGQMTFDRLMWHHYNGFNWSSEVVWDFRTVSDLLMADIDDDGKAELIAITDNGRESIAYSIEREPGQFFFTEVARLPNEEWGMGFAATADADRDLDDELYIEYGTGSFQTGILRVDWQDGAYVQDTLFQGSITGEIHGLAAGDGDNDGLDEIYLLASGFFPEDPTTLHRFSARSDGWAHQLIPMGKGFQYDLELGDGNGDGFKELYSGSNEGQLVQAMWTGSAWLMRAVYQVGSGNDVRDVSLGDTDGDGKSETYAIHYDPGEGSCCPQVSPVLHMARLAPTGGTTSTTSTTSSTMTSTGTFDASYTGVRGNEWWIQANVAAAGGTLSKVDVRLNNGAWQPLTKQSWGGWAASYHAVQGTSVQMRATSTTGATDLSSCYRWIPPSGADATVIACSGTTTSTTTSTTMTSGSPFDATFTGVKGNEWWVQANVAANQGLAGVDARVNCAGSWHPLTLQSWGGWAASFNVPNGSKVDFRARSTTGATDLSGGYVWTAATPTSAC